MLGPFMHRLDQRSESVRESAIAGATAQAPGLFEIILSETTHRAMLSLGSLLHLLVFTQPEQKIRQSEPARVGDTLLFCARLTHVDLLHIPIHDLCQVNCRRVTF